MARHNEKKKGIGDWFKKFIIGSMTSIHFNLAYFKGTY